MVKSDDKDEKGYRAYSIATVLCVDFVVASFKFQMQLFPKKKKKEIARCWVSLEDRERREREG